MRALLELAVKVAGFWLVLSLAMISPGNYSRTEAGSIVVTTTADSGPGSFREALTTAGTSAGADTITFDTAVFPPGTPATIQATAVYVVEGAAASEPLFIDARDSGVIFDFTGVTEGLAAFQWNLEEAPVDGVDMRGFTIRNFAPDVNHFGHGVLIDGATTATNLRFEEMTITNMAENALFLNAEDNLQALIEDNDFSDNGGDAVQISAGTTGPDLFFISNDMVNNTGGGISINTFDPTLSSSARIVANFIINNGGDAIFLSGQESVPNMHATITNNVTSGNAGLGINLLGFSDLDVTPNDAGDTDMGPNDLLNFPVLTGVSGPGITGTACANCTIEIFSADGDESGHGEGSVFLATGTADGAGAFNVEVCADQGDIVTATATDANGSTSEFSLNINLPAGTECENAENGDLDCDGDEDTRDALIAFIHDAEATQLSREDGCPNLGSSLLPVALPAGSSPTIFGDVNCDNSVNATDGMTLLRYLAGVFFVQSSDPSCVPIGERLLSN